jgi:hypothetical protein
MSTKTEELKSFGLADAFEIQLVDVRRWAGVIRQDLIPQLYAEAAKRNAALVKASGSPYDVWRGQDVTNWVVARSYGCQC